MFSQRLKESQAAEKASIEASKLVDALAAIADAKIQYSGALLKMAEFMTYKFGGNSEQSIKAYDAAQVAHDDAAAAVAEHQRAFENSVEALKEFEAKVQAAKS